MVFPNRLHPRRRAAAILTVCLLAASLFGTASASAASTGFYIHNLTSRALKVAGVEWDGGPEVGPTAPTPPKVGDVLPPGAPALHIEIAYRDAGVFQPVITSSVHLILEGVRPEEKGKYEITLYDNDPTHPGYHGNRTAQCEAPATRGCLANVPGELDQVRLLEFPGTSYTVKADEPGRQAEALRTLCTRASVDAEAVDCEFKLRSAAEIDGPTHDVGAPYANCTSAQRTGLVHYSENVKVTDSMNLEFEPKTEAVFERAQAGAAELGPESPWRNEHKFTGGREVSIPAGWIGWLQVSYPLVRFKGDYFRVHLGNTTWTLKDVYFDTPHPGVDPHFGLDARRMTAAERQELCPAGGLVRVPGLKATSKGGSGVR